MNDLINSLGFKTLLFKQVPIIGFSMLIIELFIKLGSFTLECLVFFSLWYILDKMVEMIREK